MSIECQCLHSAWSRIWRCRTLGQRMLIYCCLLFLLMNNIEFASIQLWCNDTVTWACWLCVHYCKCGRVVFPQVGVISVAASMPNNVHTSTSITLLDHHRFQFPTCWQVNNSSDVATIKEIWSRTCNILWPYKGSRNVDVTSAAALL